MSLACMEQDWPDVGNDEVPCCMGAAVDGPGGCTCWTAVYDLEQQEPRTDVLDTCRDSMCADCAYRPDSPERRGDEQAAGNQEFLDEIVHTGEIFWCHQGIRRPVKWVHPSGAEIPGSPLAYTPPIVKDVPYKSDGTPADICAGWIVRVEARERAERRPADADTRGGV